jgi:hypothetical protein
MTTKEREKGLPVPSCLCWGYVGVKEGILAPMVYWVGFELDTRIV